MTDIDGEAGRTARKRGQIAEAAMAVFLRNGYVGASMDEVAALAGASKQTVYKHFTDKKQLFTHIVLATTAEVDALVKVVAATLDEGDDPAKDLRRLARAFLDALLRPEVLRLRRLVIAEADRFPELGRAWYEGGFERVLTTLTTCFERLAARGRLSLDDAGLAADHLVGLLLWIPVNRAMFYGSEAGDVADAERDRLADAAVAAFLRAYGPADGP
ncbi:TetR family transcriptional regulator [Spongiactinospora gelatinilytica]|uniref:TetR family transcriptional regulator n=1 Tax=Spongiactinospora gelatinilytica TaxID=2666298 RepID=A0A2W2GZI0_9ACTN|nr:TetR/AcrR family transcriptional regulator [Spongiactinospora gelatinilytica]PZG45315.1 TetR family transcriptional regulator [Spongiactinospora gelatinilytica]